MLNDSDYRRTFKSLADSLRGQPDIHDRVSLVIDKLKLLLPECGEFSRTHMMRFRVGHCLLNNSVPTILAPACPDYSHTNGRYDFRSVGRGVSLLAQHQISFLRRITPLIGACNVVILIADHEADDDGLCNAIHKTRDEFRDAIHSSIEAVNTEVAALGWRGVAMTAFVPTLISDEAREMTRISGASELQARIDVDTQARRSMYHKLNCFDQNEMRQRTIRTASQYVAMGEFAGKHNYLVANHTTVNLASWYSRTPAAVLHNPVTVY